MSENTFFKPTVLYKEYMILDMIEKNAHVTQREISQEIGIAVSMVNSYLDDYEKKGYIKRKKYSSKNVEYFVTKKGSERRKLLNINYLHNSQVIYNLAKSSIKNYLIDLSKKGIKNLVVYGAGEVASIILNVINYEQLHSNFEIYLMDDDPTKIGKLYFDYVISSPKEITKIPYDSVFLGSYTYSDVMYNKALMMGIPKEKIIRYFE